MPILQLDESDVTGSEQLSQPQYTRESQGRVLATVIRYLIDRQHLLEARMLSAAECNIVLEYYVDDESLAICPDGFLTRNRIEIVCPTHAYDALEPLNRLRDTQFEHSQRVYRAFRAVLGERLKYFFEVSYSPGSLDLSSGWRERLLESIARAGVDANNQGRYAKESNYYTRWKDLKFASKSEVQIADALEERAVMFFPLPAARLGNRKSRTTREPDFLVCHKGKWGILEVDGSHHSGSAADDHSRDRLFLDAGIKVVQHFNADECYQTAKRVVDQFLNILANSG